MSAEYEEIIAEEEEVSQNPINYIVFFFENYGWYLVIASIVVAYIYSRISPYLEEYEKKRDRYEYEQNVYKKTDKLSSLRVAREEALKKVQEQYNIDAERYVLKQKEKEAKKREEYLARHDGKGGGSKLGKSEYNPLMGDSSGSTFKPKKKSACSGGGCGK